MTHDEKKIRVTEQLAHIAEQLEMAREMWLDDKEQECLLMLQTASREMKHVARKITPILEQ
ncbi:FMN-dependent NADH-azoreductase [Aggregatibacter kilianii]|uniref:FMN-dependent NADH-azoreductase n=1 Tax=Aggregatibacter kilianii TaxID=2025884 RepID=UPI000D644172|nr:FMN-dependent NADH-azoreductase [Aggregatibacter kilianii]